MLEEKTAGRPNPAEQGSVSNLAPRLPIRISTISGVRIWGKYSSERSLRLMCPRSLARQFYGKASLNAFLGSDDEGNEFVLISVKGRF